MKAVHHTSKLKMRLLLETFLLICLVQHSLPFGMAGSDIRASRAPITCFSPSETRWYNGSSSSSSSSTSAVDEDNDAKKENNQLEQNTKYVEGLIVTLGTLLDHWIISGAMATVRECNQRTKPSFVVCKMLFE